jgi:simple sugar transport system permease protein
LPIIEIPLIKNIPVIGEVFSGQSVYVYASWLLLFFSWIVIYKTHFGYRLRACNKHSTALVSLGIYPDTYRWTAFLISGFFCGIGGSFLGLNLGAFIPNMTAGKGWIALVIIFLGGRKPLGLIIAAFLFGLADALSNYSQGLLNIPADFILAMPYLLTLLAVIFASVWVKHKNYTP